MKCDWPSASESTIRMEAAMRSGERRSDAAQTGAPARARTVLQPIGPEEGALARHVRAADDEGLGRRAEPEVVADAALGGDQRMPERAALEADRGVDDLGKDRVRLLEGEAREGRERFDLGGDRDPDVEPRAAAGAPGLERDGDVGAPQEQRGKRREELVAALVAAIDEGSQAPELLRRRAPRRHELPGEPNEQGRSEALAFETGEQLRGSGERFDGGRRRLEDRADAAMQRPREPGLDEQRCGERNGARAAPDPERRAAEGQKRRGGARERDPARQGIGRSPGPGLERRRRVVGDRGLAATEHQSAPQVDARAELGDGGLARADPVRGGALEQPAREAIAAARRPGRGEAFEEGPGAEEVEIPGVGVARVEVAQTRVAAAGEAMLEARETVFVEALQTRGAVGP
jgi:hypothetical protein